MFLKIILTIVIASNQLFASVSSSNATSLSTLKPATAFAIVNALPSANSLLLLLKNSIRDESLALIKENLVKLGADLNRPFAKVSVNKNNFSVEGLDQIFEFEKISAEEIRISQGSQVWRWNIKKDLYSNFQSFQSFVLKKKSEKQKSWSSLFINQAYAEKITGREKEITENEDAAMKTLAAGFFLTLTGAMAVGMGETIVALWWFPPTYIALTAIGLTLGVWGMVAYDNNREKFKKLAESVQIQFECHDHKLKVRANGELMNETQAWRDIFTARVYRDDWKDLKNINQQDTAVNQLYSLQNSICEASHTDNLNELNMIASNVTGKAPPPSSGTVRSPSQAPALFISR